MDAIFIDIKDIEGDSDIAGFEKKIEVLSFSHGVAAQITGDVSNENRTSGRPMHQDFTISKYVDKATPKLNQKCCEGANLGLVTITVGRNDAGTILPFMVYILKDVVLSNVSIGGGTGGKPVETLYFPNEQHGFYNVENRVAAYEKVLSFLQANIGSGTD